MNISRVGSIATTASSSAGTTAVINLPSSVPTNARVLVALAINTSGNVTIPSGWASLFSTTDGTMKLTVMYNQFTPTVGSTLSVTIGSSDWCAIATAYTGSRFNGIDVGSFVVADFEGVAATAETATDTATTTASSIPQQFDNPGLGARVGYAAVKHATTGFASITASTGTMAMATEVVSSGSTPVTLGIGEDTVEPPTGSYTVTGTSNASSAERVVGAVSLSPEIGPYFSEGATTAVSSSAGATSGSFTIPSWRDRNQVAILHLACNAAETFSVGAPWRQVHSTTSGSLHSQVYVAKVTPDLDTTVDWTLTAAADWAMQCTYLDGVPISDDPATGGGLFDAWVVDTDTNNDTSITSTSLSCEFPYGFLITCTATRGTTFSGISTTWPASGISSLVGAGTSSGSPAVNVNTRGTFAPARSGESGTWTYTTAAATTEKLIWSAIVRPANLTEQTQQATAITQMAIDRSSRW